MRVRDVNLDALGSSERAALEDALVEVYLESFVGPTRDQVVEMFVVRGPKRKLQVYEDEGEGRVFGFTSVSISNYVLAGREVGIIDAGIYLRRRVRGLGNRGIAAVASHAQRHRAAYPGLPIASIGLTLTPVSYRLLVRFNRGFVPIREREPGAELDAQVRALLPHKGLEPVAEDPWVVRRTTLEVRPRAVDQLPSVAQMREDPDMRYYIERNPGWAAGEALMTHLALP